MNEHMEKLVLVVEDDAGLLGGILAWLRKVEAGFAVMGTSRGDRALQLIDRHRPDIVVSDVRLPGQGGLELLALCRSKYPTTRFIIMSAYPTRKLENESLRRGALQFLRKPFDLQQLERAVVQALQAECREPLAGFLRGLSVAGIVQLLEAEGQSLRLVLSREDGTQGVLVFSRGRLLHARLGETSGREAALELLSWQDANMGFEPACGTQQQTIDEPLSFLLMEAARLQDEGDRGRG